MKHNFAFNSIGKFTFSFQQTRRKHMANYPNNTEQIFSVVVLSNRFGTTYDQQQNV